MCVQKFEDEKTWFQAKDRCKNLGGTLAIISSTDQNDFIHGEFIFIILFGDAQPWSGG